jgi:hypothetical protein
MHALKRAFQNFGLNHDRKADRVQAKQHRPSKEAKSAYRKTPETAFVGEPPKKIQNGECVFRLKKPPPLVMRYLIPPEGVR